MYETIPQSLLKPLEPIIGQPMRLYARYLDGKRGAFAEFWLQQITTREHCSVVDGRLTKEFLRFVEHASFQREQTLQFGITTGDVKVLCTGYILSFNQLDDDDRVQFTIDFLTPWSKVE